MPSQELQSAISLIKSGNKEEGQKILVQLLRTDPKNETTWLWLLETMESKAQRIAALQQYLKINPDSQTAQKALNLLQEQPKTATDTSREDRPEPESSDLTHPASAEEEIHFAPSAVSPSAQSDEMDPGDMHAESSEEDRWVLPEMETEQPETTPSTALEPEHPSILRSAAAQEELEEYEPQPEVEASELRKQFKEIQDSPEPATASLGKRIFRGFLIASLLLLILCALGVTYLIFTGRLENPFARLNSQQISTLTALETEKALLQTQSTLETPTPIQNQALNTAATNLPTREIALPVALYFLAPAEFGDQIWVVEPNGSNVRQITNLISPVTGFDVSPLNGMLAYISGNQLYIASPDGSNSQSILQGPVLPEKQDETYWKEEISSPVWSPDGSKLAVAMGGVKMISFSDSVISTMIENMIPSDTQPASERVIYKPLQWSPDSVKLSVREERADCDRLAILSTNGDAPLLGIGQPNSSPAWSLDSQSLFAAVPAANCSCESAPGLAVIDAQSGEINQMIEVEGKSNYIYIGWPRPIENNQVLYFIGTWSGSFCEDMPETSDMLMTVSDAADFSLRTLLRSDRHAVSEALWSADHNFAVVVDPTSQNNYVLYTDNSPAAALSIQGHNLRWGIAESTIPTATPIPFQAAPVSETTAQDLGKIALQAADLPLFYVEKEETPPQGKPGLIKSIARSFSLTETTYSRVFLNQISLFANESQAQTYFMELKETRLPKNESLPTLVGDEAFASRLLTTSVDNSTETYQVVWRYRETIVLLQLHIENTASINSDEIADLARKIQSRLLNTAP